LDSPKETWILVTLATVELKVIYSTVSRANSNVCQHFQSLGQVPPMTVSSSVLSFTDSRLVVQSPAMNEHTTNATQGWLMPLAVQAKRHSCLGPDQTGHADFRHPAFRPASS
jgi:hypothetical protein